MSRRGVEIFKGTAYQIVHTPIEISRKGFTYEPAVCCVSLDYEQPTKLFIHRLKVRGEGLPTH